MHIYVFDEKGLKQMILKNLKKILAEIPLRKFLLDGSPNVEDQFLSFDI